MNEDADALRKTELTQNPDSGFESSNANGGAFVHCADGYGLAANNNYLAKCQVDTPLPIVKRVWQIVRRYRKQVGIVFDAGAGDGRFATGGAYKAYTGYEIDPKRQPISPLPANATVLRACAFAQSEPGAFDLAIGNPPYVRHHDLSDAWRHQISNWIEQQTGVRPSGLSNAYLYFLWLALITTRNDGLVVYLIPFDWVTRPAARSLREFIQSRGWQLDIYRFDEEPFPDVMTTACVAVIDKRAKRASPKYFRLTGKGEVQSISSPTLTSKPPLAYKKREKTTYARRGLSPGDQSVFLLSDDTRKQYSLRIGVDVVPAVSSLRHIEKQPIHLTETFFKRNFVETGVPCWLISPTDSPSKQLVKYLDQVGDTCRSNSTCSKREIWWQFKLPQAPKILYASGFRGSRPKAVLNDIGAIAVGSVCGIYTNSVVGARRILERLAAIEVKSQVVALSRGFTKIEVNQMNGLLQAFME